MSTIANNASYGLQVTKDFRMIANVNFISMIITVMFSFLLMKSYGTQGALLGLLLGNTFLAIPLWILFFARAFDKEGVLKLVEIQGIGS